MRVAAIDQGTNTTRLLVADVQSGRIGEVERRLAITRLGEGVDARRRLLPVAIARVRNTLSDYRRIAEGHGAERILLIATSAVRDAENGEALLGEIEWSYGFTTRLLTGEEEAALAFRGAVNGRPTDGPVLVVDVGGGSTELVIGDGGEVRSRISLDVGSVRLTERYLHSDPPTPDELAGAADAARGLLPDPPDPGAVIGVAGTITTLAALEAGLDTVEGAGTDGMRLTHEAVERQCDRLASLRLAERRRLPGLHPERAPVIVAGAVIVHELMAGLRLDSLEVSERDILHGAALEAANLPEPVEGDAPPGAYTCC